MTFAFQLHVLEPWSAAPLTGKDPLVTQTGHKIAKLPILELFGRTSEGKTVCAHVHNCFPYILIDFPGDQTPMGGEAFIASLTSELNGRLETQAVYKMYIVRGRSVYGYRANCSPFVKILFLQPHLTKQAANLFYTTTVLNHKFNVFEAHVPWELQFMMDHNLYGMGKVRVGKYTVRSGAVNDFMRLSKADIEIDIQAENILNRLQLLRFRNSRGDASGPFIRSHFMPSVVDMLESMNLDATTQSQEVDKPESSFLTSNHLFDDLSVDCQREAHEACEDFCRLLPDACDYDLIVDRKGLPATYSSFDWASSPIGGGSISVINIPEKIDVDRSTGDSALISTPSRVNMLQELPFHELVENDEDSDEDPADSVFTSSLYSNRPVTSSQTVMKFPELEFDIQELSSQLIQSPAFKQRRQKLSSVYRYRLPPPSRRELEQFMTQHSIPSCIYQTPYYTEAVVNNRNNIAGNIVTIPVINVDNLTPFNNDNERVQVIVDSRILRPLYDPPSTSQLDIHDDILEPADSEFNVDLSKQECVCLLSVEVFAACKGNMLPDPLCDQVLAIVYTAYTRDLGMVHGLITWQDNDSPLQLVFECVDIIKVADEESMFLALISVINDQYDADILLGYDIQRASFGFLDERAKHVYGYELTARLSRRRSFQQNQKAPAEKSLRDNWFERKTSVFQVFGRITLNVWRVMRSELELLDYSFEAVYRHVFGRHQPRYNPHQLLKKPFSEATEYFLQRTMGSIALLIETQVFTRTCEFARLFGVDFYSVVSRGSQFKVESLMLRLGHLESFLFLSPGKQDVVKMRAPECLQLIMEPEGQFYMDPIVVLDYQSLYPSVMIAYNYCFSTCLGRSSEPFPRHLGVHESYASENIGRGLDNENILSSVNRVSFVKKNVREGLLSKMLTELLDARIKIKNKMSQTDDLLEKRILDARQLGIKFILNVTYGYTAASFSGRMPCVDVADSIVATGRATLENAIKYIESNTDWQARVVYGDTDSLFVMLPNRTMDEAFTLGKQMAQRLSDIVPYPMSLKFEKVYQPACLMAKKRYCARRWDNPKQRGYYEGKGVETVRRDGCPLVRNLFKRTAEMLFEEPNMTRLKAFVQSECLKIINGGYDEEDPSLFIFSREVRFGTYASDREDDEDAGPGPNSRRSATLPPAAVIAQWRLRRDKRDVAEYGERVPYIVIYQKPDSRLTDCLRIPEALLDGQNSINHIYYITKHFLPSINRMILLTGVDVQHWWQSLPRTTSRSYALPHGMDGFVIKRECVVCRHPGDMHDGIIVCRYCLNHEETSLNVLMLNIDYYRGKQETILIDGHRLCKCANHFDSASMCMSLSCPVFWRVVVFRRIDAKILGLATAAGQRLCSSRSQVSFE